MRSAAWVETLLALVLPPERAAAVAGDLMEDPPEGRPVWISVARIAAASVWQDLQTFLVPMAGAAAVWWFAYLFMSVAYTFFGNLVLYLLNHHTGLELLMDLPWPPPPPSPESWTGPFIWWAWVPFQAGGWMARCWPGREVSAWFVLAVFWILLAALTKIALPAIGLVQVFALAGAVNARRRGNLQAS
jgi:hypothetical protein